MHRLDFIKDHYTYKRGDKARDEFLVPALNESISYDRSVGFYTGYSLLAYGLSLHRIIRKEGYKIRLIASPKLGNPEISALEKKVNRDEEYLSQINKHAEKIIDEACGLNACGQVDNDNITKILCWMLANDKLEIRLAIPVHVYDAGDHHEKEGIIHLPDGEKIWLHGSINESANAWFRQGDNLYVKCSWRNGEKTDVDNALKMFNEIWHSCDDLDPNYPGVRIKSINGT